MKENAKNTVNMQRQKTNFFSLFKSLSSLTLIFALLMSLASCIFDKPTVHPYPSAEELLAMARQISRPLISSKTQLYEVKKTETGRSEERKASLIYLWEDKEILRSYQGLWEEKGEEREELWFPSGAFQKINHGNLQRISLQVPQAYSYQQALKVLEIMVGKLSNSVEVMQDPQYEEVYRMHYESNDSNVLQALSTLWKDILEVPTQSLFVQLDLQLAKAQGQILGYHLLLSDKEDPAQHLYEVYLAFSQLNDKNLQIKKPEVLIEDTPIPQEALDEEKKALIKQQFDSMMSEAQKNFDAINVYDTEATFTYEVQIENSFLTNTIVTSGSEYYENNKYQYFIGREVREQSESKSSVALALKEDESYEKDLKSLNEASKKEENTSSEEETRAEETTGNEENTGLEVTESGWIKLNQIIPVKYYANLLQFLRDHQEKLSLVSTNDGFSIQLKGESPLFLEVLRDVIGADMSRFSDLTIEGEMLISYEVANKQFTMLQLNVQSKENDSLRVKASRDFTKLRTDDLLPWPVQ